MTHEFQFFFLSFSFWALNWCFVAPKKQWNHKSEKVLYENYYRQISGIDDERKSEIKQVSDGSSISIQITKVCAWWEKAISNVRDTPNKPFKLIVQLISKISLECHRFLLHQTLDFATHWFRSNQVMPSLFGRRREEWRGDEEKSLDWSKKQQLTAVIVVKVMQSATRCFVEKIYCFNLARKISHSLFILSKKAN